jgi:hypothetical protein
MPLIARFLSFGCALAIIASFCTSAIAQLALAPPNAGPLDVVRLRWSAVACTNPDSVRVSMQSNQIFVSADRLLVVDCGTIQGYFNEYTLGRLPTGDYDVQLAVNPPPGTLGPTLLIGPIHLVVSPFPPTGSPLPHDDYSDVWYDPNETGQSLTVKQSGAQLVAGWNVYDAAGHPVWYTLQPGKWMRDSGNVLFYSGVVYKTTGPYWAAPFDAGALSITAVGTGNFVPQAPGRARFDYVIEGVAGSKQLQRFVF